ncbi:MAG: SdrD B-like domain-containing protein, partial [Anaerolineales bacterium]
YILRGTDIAACVWQGSAKAWIDSNGDGLFNSGEHPLSNVEIHIDDVKNQRTDAGWPVTTDHDGDVRFNVSIPGCSNTVFQIYVEIPEGYRMTTKPRIEVTPDFREILSPESVYYFGFVSDR